MNALDFSSQVVLVTGGTRGIGAAIARAFAAHGAAVSACARAAPEPPGDDITFIRADVRDPDQAANAVEQVIERHGRIDVLVNNAGGTAPALAATVRPESARSVVTLNLLAPFYVAQRANAFMQDQPEGGVILNIGSVADLRPAPGVALYAAAKAGLAGLTRVLALEWGPKVRVNVVTPGLVETEGSARHYGGDEALAAAGRTVPRGMAVPDDIGAICLLLACPLAAHVSGAELRVDGGGEVPGWLVAVRAASRAS
jgi:NAD(P)-dependent dehydrogenase (short-subunit alcohol dehydrogenase family)